MTIHFWLNHPFKNLETSWSSATTSWPRVRSLTHLQTRGELHHLFSLHVPQPVHTSDTVTDGQYAASLLQIRTSVGSKNLLLQNAGHLRCAWKTRQSEWMQYKSLKQKPHLNVPSTTWRETFNTRLLQQWPGSVQVLCSDTCSSNILGNLQLQIYWL